MFVSRDFPFQTQLSAFNSTVYIRLSNFSFPRQSRGISSPDEVIGNLPCGQKCMHSNGVQYVANDLKFSRCLNMKPLKIKSTALDAMKGKAGDFGKLNSRFSSSVQTPNQLVFQQLNARQRFTIFFQLSSCWRELLVPNNNLSVLISSPF